ncbi:MAG TPA: hypothetical protein VJZ00_22620 [Thermoanaerobaculia bacterium]|nr:hypothetical protein [Thermoanaerobaculia bacterium]
MRRSVMLFVLVFAFPLIAQRPVTPPPMRCCDTKVYDATGHEMGEVIHYSEDFIQSFMMRYRLKDGDTVAVRVGSEYILSSVLPGGSNVLFTAADCSGDAFVVITALPMKRQSMVLPVGTPGFYAATSAWLYVSAPLATRTVPAPGTIFKAQWDMSACVPYPPPGYTYMGGTYGGFWMKRVEDLYAHWKRPYWIP